MAKSGSAPADSRAPGDSDAAERRGSLPNPVVDGAEGGTRVDMAAYKETVPRWERVWRHSFTQMVLLSVQAFCGPAMSDAIAGKRLSLPSHGL